MSTAGSHLLKADEQRLKVVVRALSRGGRMVVVVAGDPVWGSARELLARELPGASWAEFTLTSGDEVMRMFASPEVREPGIVVLHVGAADRRAMHALNLNRDKLTRQACQFVLRLAGREAQERFTKEAADAYSVRDALAFVEGGPTAKSIRSMPMKTMSSDGSARPPRPKTPRGCSRSRIVWRERTAGEQRMPHWTEDRGPRVEDRAFGG
ncbi:MAG: hypothetical protein R3F14_16010 [Polyangiaceae bacterium]